MAFSAKNILLLVLFTLLSSKHIYARDSRFFSKIPRTYNDNTKTSNVDNYKTLEEEAKEIEKQVLGPLYKEKDSNVIPENESGRPFGLYGQRDEKFASLDNDIVNVDSYNKIVEKSDSLEKVNDYTEKNIVIPDVYRPYILYDNEVKGNLPNNYNAESYVTDSQGYHRRNTGKDGYNYGGNRYYGDSKAMEKQGMSDTQFLEDGKYFYDINLEKNGRFGYKNVENDGRYFHNQEDITKEDIPNEYKIGYNNKGKTEDFKFDYELPNN